MKMNVKNLFAGVILMTAVSACAPSQVPFTNFTAFTEDLRRDLENAGIPLEKVQFYNDKPITVKREGINPNDINVNSEGSISIQNGKTIQTINVRPFTPGVVLGTGGGSMNVSWDDTQQDTKGMRFNLNGNQYYLSTTEDAKLDYKGSLFDIQAGIGTRLFVNKDLLKQVNVQRETQKGRRVGGQ
ncbi:hypothetical protein [Telluribacter sp.]|jgi:hypothetical protein|uniref:hypothetical protein n=1 Tax=Telluribacter sp. TaxID=1978767 RepID=UPI002E0D134F|nr:hypothetical protein [Telluribacter sp.]